MKKEKNQLMIYKKYGIFQINLDLVAECFETCFDGQLLQNKCANNCYKHYLNTLKVITQETKERGYKVHSLYAYKMFPIRQPRFQLVYNERFKPTAFEIEFSVDPVSLKEI
ncbi:unnamed protein product [Paramecium primaurelia]|uniref:Uncharacterized protein n=1 Tax=Paramecium primaurelia TaxID=5886 RepID=A0A8S1P7K4_PARPR|nr:unnamed protein product [Paramecium primaurelia]